MQFLTHTLTAHPLTDVEIADRGRRAISSRRSARRSPRPAAASWTGSAPVLRPSRALRPHPLTEAGAVSR